MKARWLVRPQAMLFVALWLLFLIGGRSRFFQDPGTFWHTRVGEQIMTSRGFFSTDEFTFTFTGQTWIPHQWLGECLMALAHSVDRFDSLLLATATILAALFTWLGSRLMRCGLHPSVAVVLMALAVAASSGHFHVRPHLATIVGFAVTMAFIVDHEAGRIGSGRLACLIPLFWIWSNIHGGMLGGLATFALAILGWCVYWRLGWDSPVRSGRDLGIHGIILVGCGATCLINPYGARLPEAWLDIYRMQSLPRLIKEHSPLDLDDRNAWVVLLYGVVYLILLAATWPERPRVGWLLPLVWLGLGCMRVRHAPLFAVAATVCIADLFPRTRFAFYLEASGSDLFETPPAVKEHQSLAERLGTWLIPAVLVSLSFGLQAARVELPVIGHGWARLDPAVWPIELLEELRQHQNERRAGIRIFNEYAHGGFLIYFTPGYRVFVDDRCELFGDAWLSDFIDAPLNDPRGHLERWQATYGPLDYALVYDQEPGFIGYFEKQPDWELVKRNEWAALFKRRH